MRRIALLFLFVLLAAPLAAQTAPNPGCTAAFDPPNVGFLKDSTRYTATRIIRFYSITNMGLWITCPTVLPVDSTAYNAALATIGALRDTITALRAATPPPAPVDSATLPPPAPTGSNTPNRPANYTRVVSDYAFTEAPPTTSNDQCFGSAGWCMIGGGTSVVRRLTDATAPNADKTVWEQTYAPGGGGENAAGIFYRNDAGVAGTKLYASVWVWYSPGFEWNTVSQKFLYWESGNLLLQQDHNGVPLSMYIGAPGYDVVYDPNQGCALSLSAFEGKWRLVEWQVERGSPGLLRVWFDGKLCSDYKVTVPPNGNQEFNLNSTWGGGGQRSRTSFRRVDHLLIATP